MQEKTIKLNKYNPLVIITPEGKVIDLSLVWNSPKAVKLGFDDKEKATVYRKELWEKVNEGI